MLHLQFNTMQGKLPHNLGFYLIELEENSFEHGGAISYYITLFIECHENGWTTPRAYADVNLFDDDDDSNLSKRSDDGYIKKIEGKYYRMFKTGVSANTLVKTLDAVEILVFSCINKLNNIIQKLADVKSKQGFMVNLY